MHSRIGGENQHCMHRRLEDVDQSRGRYSARALRDRYQARSVWCAVACANVVSSASVCVSLDNVFLRKSLVQYSFAPMVIHVQLKELSAPQVCFFDFVFLRRPSLCLRCFDSALQPLTSRQCALGPGIFFHLTSPHSPHTAAYVRILRAIRSPNRLGSKTHSSTRRQCTCGHI